MNDITPSLQPSLYVHHTAAKGINLFRKMGVVGDHTVYLIGIEVPAHRGGPALIALLVLHDGRLLGARSEQLSEQPDLTELFRYDVIYTEDAENLRAYTRTWNRTLGGFCAVVREAVSDYEAARFMLQNCSSALALSKAVALENDQQLIKRWDDSATVIKAEEGVVCAVYGFSPDPADVAALDISDDLKRSLTIGATSSNSFLLEFKGELLAGATPRIVGVLEEAIDNRLRSPRACVALLRTATEIVVESLGTEHSIDLGPRVPLAGKIELLQSAWHKPTKKPTMQDRRENAWRANMILALDTSRDIGNMIHFDHDVTIDDADHALSVTEKLLSTWLRRGVLDK